MQLKLKKSYQQNKHMAYYDKIQLRDFLYQNWLQCIAMT